MNKRMAGFSAVLCALLGPVSALQAHDDHGHGQLSWFWHFVQDNRLTIQITGGTVLALAVALMVIMRLKKGQKSKDPQPPVAQDPPAPESSQAAGSP